LVIVGIDAHERTLTAVAIDEAGRKLGQMTRTRTTTEANLELVRWAERFGPERRFAVEDCRHLSRRLEADLHRPSRTGNRQLNAALHRIAITQMRIHEPAKDHLARRIAMGNTKTEALRALKRRLSDVVFRALLADAEGAASVDEVRAA
jgi:ribosomal protein S4